MNLEIILVRTVLVLTAALSVGISLWGGYYLLTGLMSWRRPMDYGRHPAGTRFAVLIAARNEELVIGPLINSLLEQEYPAELYDIYVIPNNCTDNTALAARQFGAEVLECTVPVRSKGEVLRFAEEQLSGRHYDAFCVFDADNVVDRCFLKEMNNAYRAGARAAQGYRDSKNPYDSAISGCYSIYYWMMDRFHNQGKAGLGLSAMINGTGFMVAASTLKKLGGWRTETISEDLEMTAQCVLADVQVAWVPLAVTYDEQPLTYRESVKQRRRWSSGTIQVARQYLPRTGRQMTAAPRGALLDIGMTMLIPAYQLVAVVNTLAAAAAAGLSGRPFTFAAGAFCGAILLNVGLTAVFATLSGALVLTVERKWDRRLWKSLLVYWLFLLSWLPITIGSFFKQTTVWEEIRHTRNVLPEPVLARKWLYMWKKEDRPCPWAVLSVCGKSPPAKSSGDRWAAPNRSQTQWIRFGTEEQGSGRMSAR